MSGSRASRSDRHLAPSKARSGGYRRCPGEPFARGVASRISCRVTNGRRRREPVSCRSAGR
jgi:hypothetical protein